MSSIQHHIRQTWGQDSTHYTLSVSKHNNFGPVYRPTCSPAHVLLRITSCSVGLQRTLETFLVSPHRIRPRSSSQTTSQFSSRYGYHVHETLPMMKNGLSQACAG